MTTDNARLAQPIKQALKEIERLKSRISGRDDLLASIAADLSAAKDLAQAGGEVVSVLAAVLNKVFAGSAAVDTAAGPRAAQPERAAVAEPVMEAQPVEAALDEHHDDWQHG